MAGWPSSYWGVRKPVPFVYPAEVEIGRNRSRTRSVEPGMQLLRPILSMVVRSLGPGRLRIVVVKFARRLDQY